jgi:predicted DNA-binding transcriptional regulator YafY
MNQLKMYRCIKLMQFLQEKPRQIYSISKYLCVSKRTVYRYLKLYEALGYTIVKDKFDKIQIYNIKNN